ncbi:hypothetical protein ACH47B_06695 [Rhodococcus sp. NPDC019627]|uniref:hypothetical protein n=1 Tax=unclassified Rhodococcus (in: high G+C Gram-positive bacteria) TaxID=192944 RepID=UPI003795E7DA
MTKNVLNDVRGPELEGPGYHALVWDVDGRAWLQDLSTGRWLCDFPLASLSWPELRAKAGPIYALPGTSGGRRPADPAAAVQYFARETAIRTGAPVLRTGGRAARRVGRIA